MFHKEAELEQFLGELNEAAYEIRRGQAGHYPARRLAAHLRRQGFLPTQHFLDRFRQRIHALGVRFDPRLFGLHFYRARHYRQTRPGYNTRVAVMRGIPIVYRMGGQNANRVVLVSLLSEGALLPPVVPVRPPRPREGEAMFGWLRRRFGAPRRPARAMAARRPLAPRMTAAARRRSPYREEPTSAEIQQRIAETTAALAQAIAERTAAEEQLRRAEEAAVPVIHPRPGRPFDLDSDRAILRQLELARQHLRNINARISQLEAELEQLRAMARRTPEGEAMLRTPRGRPRPPRGADVVTLYHYSPTIIRDAIRRGSNWTQFGGRNPQDVGRITGRDPREMRYRYELRLTRAERDRMFRDIATKMVPGLPASSEYVNQVAVPISWIQRMQPIQ